MVGPVVELPGLPALVLGHVGHRRHTPLKKEFVHRHYQWLVDVDEIPDMGWPWSLISAFSPEDHLQGGAEDGTIKGDLVAFLTAEEIAVAADDQILMLAHARVLGHVFDPLTVFWVLDPKRRVKALVFEVHNTRDERHSYLVMPDKEGRDTIDKVLYVSPFNDNRGRYHVQATLSPKKVAVNVDLERHSEPLIDTWVGGEPQRVTRARLARAFLTHPFMPQQVTSLIRFHGIKLWAKRLPIIPRPESDREPESDRQ